MISLGLLAAATLLFPAGRLEADQTLKLPDGTQRSFALHSMDAEGNLTGLKGGKKEIVKKGDWIRLGHPVAGSRLDSVLLRNGSAIACVVQSLDQESIRIESRLFSNRSLPTTAVVGILFRQSRDPLRRFQAADKAFEIRSSAELALLNGDFVSGTLNSNTSRNALTLNIGSGGRTIPLDQLAAIYLPRDIPSSPEPTPRKTASQIGFQDGSQIGYRNLTIRENELLFNLWEGLELTVPLRIRDQPVWKQVRYLQPALESCRWLNESETVRITDSLSRTFLKTRWNRNAANGPLLCQGQLFERGLGTRPNSQVIHSVGPQDRKFRAELSLDDSAAELGNATCRVALFTKDGKWKSVGKPLKISRSSGLQKIEVEVSGCRAIGLVTTTGENGTVGGRVNWLDARFHR
ncbi:MAG: NPCBM/NEW2 domain-containing protein [Planctomycetota bacterium]|nr:NPCBM/NEW2 domain-containing protein [Planctomycetota bacterium]